MYTRCLIPTVCMGIHSIKCALHEDLFFCLFDIYSLHIYLFLFYIGYASKREQQWLEQHATTTKHSLIAFWY